MTQLAGGEPEVRQVWKMARNCAISPSQFFMFYCLLVVVSFATAGLCAAFGAPAVLPFAGVELLVVGALFLLYARHAADYDLIELSSGCLLIERSDGARFQRFELNAHWTRIRLQSAWNPKIEIRCAGQCVLVGSHVPAHRRALIVGELRRSLRNAEIAPLRDAVAGHAPVSYGK
jgi:uncharacterized membrane protein